MLALNGIAWSQAKKPKVAFGDTIKNKFYPTGVRFGVDAIGLIKDKATKNWRGWEFNGDIDFYRYFLSAEYGNWSRHEILSNGTYTNDGNYFRIGADVNFMLKERHKNMFFMGFRYGTSTFSESTSYSYTEPANATGYSNSYQITESHSGIGAHWIELTSGLRVKIWGPFWMGYTVRLKFAPSVKGAGSLHPFDVPGYGLLEKTNYWGLNYQLMWRIPVRRVK